MKVSLKWSYATTRHIMFWLSIAIGLGLFLSKETPWGNDNRPFLDWLTNDFNWIAPIILLCVVPLIYLFRAADKIHADYVAKAEANNKALESKVAIYEERARPKLKVSFSKAVSGCCATNNNGSLYFRLLIMLDCSESVTGCSGVLTRVRRGSDGKVLMNHETVPLPFMPSHDGDAMSKTLVPGRPFYLDMLVVNEASQQLQSPGPGGKIYLLKDNSGNYVFSKPDKYILSVNVAGNGIPTQNFDVIFNWTGDYNTVDYSVS